MKKIIAAFASVAVIASASSAFAGFSTGDANGSLVVGSTVKATLKLSANVSVEYKANTTTAPNLGYSLATSHSSGSKTYASSSGDTRIFFKDVTASSAPAAPAAGASADFSGWTAMQ